MNDSYNVNQEPDYHIIDGFELDMILYYGDDDGHVFDDNNGIRVSVIDWRNEELTSVLFTIYQHYDPNLADVRGRYGIADFVSRNKAESIMKEWQKTLDIIRPYILVNKELEGK